MSNLHAILYISSASHRLSEQELSDLLDSARIRNAEKGITGILLYSEGRFMQYIEGEQEPLLQVYDKILSSHLHEDVMRMVYEPIATRAFADWDMAFSQKSWYELVPMIISAQNNHDHVEPASRMKHFQQLLNQFWANQ